jgi:hypothetical protein
MEYICETSQADQKVGRALCGCSDPQCRVYAPSLQAIIIPDDDRSKIDVFVRDLFRLSMEKLGKKSFADVIAASLLMYLNDTLRACRNHLLHSQLITAAKSISFFDTDEIILKKLLLWGENIRSRFLADNILQFKASVLLDNLSEENINEKFIGVHTFSEVLNKLIGGIRSISNEMSLLRSAVLEISHKTDALISINTTQSEQINRLLSKAAAQSTSDANNIQSNTIVSSILVSEKHLQGRQPNVVAVVENHNVFRQPRSWPTQLRSPGEIQFADLVFQYIADAIYENTTRKKQRCTKTSQSSN